MKKILITGGHITPALAVMEILKGEFDICFVGREYASENSKVRSVEKELVEDFRAKFINFNAGRMSKHLSFSSILSFFKIPFGFCKAFLILLKEKPDVVLSFGGYLSSPFVFSAFFLRIPSLTHEQTTTLGLANRFNSFFAKKTLLSWRQTLKEINSKKAVLVGNPVRKDIFEFSQKVSKSLKFNEDLPIIFITGGNQGSHIINKKVSKIVRKLVKSYNVFHLVGHLQEKGDYKFLKALKKELAKKYKARYRVEKYLNGKQMSVLLHKASLVVSRSGANTITELALLGKPSLLIPIPNTRADEQMKNAQILQSAGTALIIPQEELTSKLLFEKISYMIENLDRFEENSIRAKSLVFENAALNIVLQIKDILK